MRLLVVSNLYPPAAVGGYEMQCADTMDALSAEHSILVLTSAPAGGGGELRRAHAEDRGVQVLRELPFLSEDRRSDSFRAPLAAVRGARAMRAALAQWRPDLIFVWNAAAIPHSALWAAQQSGAPMAYYVASTFFSGLYENDRFGRHLTGHDTGIRRVWATLMALVNRAPELRIVPTAPFHASVCWVSEATRAQVPAPGWMQVDVERIINPGTRRYERFAAAERHPAGGAPKIAFVGRLEHEKGPDVALRALAHLVLALGVDATLELAGPGEAGYVGSLRRLAGELGIADRVTFRGPLELDGVIELLATADVALVPSVWQEPMAAVCIEAAFARIPVVASLSGGMPEALRPDREALYFPIGDWEACAGALAATLREQTATAARVAQARERANAFSFETYMAQIAELIESARDAVAGGAIA
jgi:glycosyltransferase involved in cell wall biosynthesis